MKIFIIKILLEMLLEMGITEVVINGDNKSREWLMESWRDS